MVVILQLFLGSLASQALVVELLSDLAVVFLSDFVNFLLNHLVSLFDLFKMSYRVSHFCPQFALPLALDFFKLFKHGFGVLLLLAQLTLVHLLSLFLLLLDLFLFFEPKLLVLELKVNDMLLLLILLLGFLVLF